MSGPSYVNAYSVTRHFGGPEEGGWWYDIGKVLESVEIVPGPDRAKQIAAARKHLTAEYGHISGRFNRFSAACDGSDLELREEDTPGANYPTERPYYS